MRAGSWLTGLVLLAALPVCGGCAPGLVYTHITRPLDTDLDGTPLRFDRGREDSKLLELNSFRIEWGSMGIIDAARRAGLSEIDYADLETLSVLGIWTQRWALVYGRKADSAAEPPAVGE